jgi:outer membrane lipoprotein SlyB
MITENKRTYHPMILIACITLILFCAAGTAAIMGWIPSSIGRNVDNVALANEKKLEIDNTKAVVEKPHHASHPVRVQTIARNDRQTCAECGVIESVRAIETRGEGSGVGAVGGAVVGGLLGNQVGGGHGKEAMTVVGAIGGAMAGNQIEKHVKSDTSYEVVVRMENGSSRVMHEANQPSWHNGDRVKVVDGTIRSA